MPDIAPQPNPAVLFTAFEPSGDEHAAGVIEALLCHRPDVTVFAAGGPKMRAAGARVFLDTTENAAMGLPGLGKILEHRRLNRQIDRWLDEHPVSLFVPVDSPAANFPIARMAKARGIPVYKLVAPQLWAWAPWRIRKTRRLIDKVLCILPFEEHWFHERGVDAEYVGHPIFGAEIDEAKIDKVAQTLPCAEERLAILPGSRPAEIEKNYPTMLGAFVALKDTRPALIAVVAATNERIANRIAEINEQTVGGPPEGLSIVTGQADAVIRWSAYAVATSGTVTLRVCRHGRPLVAMFRIQRLMWNILPRWALTTPFILLPNIIMGREIVPELAPYFGGPARLTTALDELMSDKEAQRRQLADQAELSERFGRRNTAQRVAALISEALPQSSPS